MTPHAALLTGLLVGFSVAVPVGPLGLLCIQRTLAAGWRAGVSTGLGGATANVAYAALILFGLDRLAPLMAGSGRALSFAGGVFLLWSARGVVLRRRALPGQAQPAALRPLAAYGSAVLFNAANPMAPVLMLALLAPAAGVSAPSLGGASVLLGGMFAAAASWWVCLCGGVSLLRARLTPGALGVVNQAAAALLTFYGALALARSAGM